MCGSFAGTVQQLSQLNRQKLPFATATNNPFLILEIKLFELPNLPSTGVKPVGRCCFVFVFLIVAKPGFHRREVGWGAGRCVRPPLASRQWFAGLETTDTTQQRILKKR